MPPAVVVQSLGSLSEWNPGWTPRSNTWGNGLSLYDGYTHDYAAIYRTQPNVRTVVEFLGRNVAQLGLHVFERASDLDRVRLNDHGLARVIRRPNPWTTRYRLIESLVADVSIYGRALWLKIKMQELPPDQPFGLLRVPWSLVTLDGNAFAPKKFHVGLGGEQRDYTPDEVVYFRMYDPDSGSRGLSPLETLRRILAEEDASGRYREGFWKNGARIGGWIERPMDSPEWGDAERKNFGAQWRAVTAGDSNSGATPVLEDGMKYHAEAFNPQESQYLESRKLTREECARAYHVPLPMVGILDHATFSNISEQHRNLYQDTLGPWLTMIEEEFTLQILPEFPDAERLYVEFNIREKLEGTFEEQAKTLQSLVGRPIMSANEGRARLNLPQSDDPTANDLVLPLNVTVGGLSSPNDTAPVNAANAAEPKARVIEVPFRSPPLLLSDGAKASGLVDPTRPQLRARHRQKWQQVIAAYFDRQRAAVESALAGKRVAHVDYKAAGDVVTQTRWNRELRSDLFKLNKSAAVAWALYVAEAFDATVDEDRMDEYLGLVSATAAERINATTADQVRAALSQDDPTDAVRHAFEIAATSRAAQIAVTMVGRAANFGSHEGAKQSGHGSKTWQVNSGNPRSQHAALNGETVAMGENFSNGMRWPIDTGAGVGPEDIANCECSVVFQR